MKDNQDKIFSALGLMIEYKTQAVCLYAQASNIMYPHSPHWSFQLREMSAQSQKQHDVLCRFTTGEQILNAVRAIQLVEQPEEKDELTLLSLELLYKLESLILDIQVEKEEHPAYEKMLYTKETSQYFQNWLKWAHGSFSSRFSTRKKRTIACAICGWGYVAAENTTFDDTCPFCESKNAMG